MLLLLVDHYLSKMLSFTNEDIVIDPSAKHMYTELFLLEWLKDLFWIVTLSNLLPWKPMAFMKASYVLALK